MVTGLDQLEAVNSKVITTNKNSDPSAVGQLVEVKLKGLWIRSDGGNFIFEVA